MASVKKKRHKSENKFFARWANHINYALNNLIRNIGHHYIAYMLTCFVIAITITLPSLGYVLWKNSDEAAHLWQPTPNLTLYLSKSITASETDHLLSELNVHPYIKEVTYITADDALIEFRTWSGFEQASDLLDFNPLPAVIVLQANDDSNKVDVLNQLKDELTPFKEIDDIKFDDSWFTRLMALTDMIQVVVWIISILMIMAVFLVISNSIRLSIFARRETIHVMQLIGATDTFILRPFLYDGVLIGAISAVIGIAMTQFLVFQLEAIILNVSSLFGMQFSLMGLTWNDSFAIIFGSASIGWLAAYTATQRYLRTKHHF